MMQRDNIIIKSFDEKDVFGIAEIEKKCFSEPWSYETIKSELNNPLAVIFTAICEERVIGYINAHVILDEANINNIAVTESYRKKGIAQMLISTFLNNINVTAIHLEVRESNLAAISLYKKFGFENVGLRKDFYTKPTENAILMTKKVLQ